MNGGNTERMREALKELDEVFICFICDECNITESELYSMDEDTLYDVVYDHMCDIEIAEIPDGDEEESEHCKKASAIVTILGNAIAEEDIEE